MNIERICTGNVSENCFLVKSSGKLFIIDPGADAEKIINRIEEKKCVDLDIEVLFTHAHADHIGAAGMLAKRFPQAVFYLDSKDVPIYVSEDNAFPPYIPLSVDLPETCNYRTCEEYKVIACPGHTPGGVAILFSEDGVQHLFSGDTLFAGSVGRTDFAGGSMTELKKTLAKLVSTLDDDVVVHPGHGPDTTIGNEKRNNFYLADIV